MNQEPEKTNGRKTDPPDFENFGDWCKLPKLRQWYVIEFPEIGITTAGLKWYVERCVKWYKDNDKHLKRDWLQASRNWIRRAIEDYNEFPPKNSAPVDAMESEARHIAEEQERRDIEVRENEQFKKMNRERRLKLVFGLLMENGNYTQLAGDTDIKKEIDGHIADLITSGSGERSTIMLEIGGYLNEYKSMLLEKGR